MILALLLIPVAVLWLAFLCLLALALASPFSRRARALLPPPAPPALVLRREYDHGRPRAYRLDTQ